MSGFLGRAASIFFEPAESPAHAPPPPATATGAAAADAAVVGAPGVVVPVAAACAGELRARARAAAAVVCIWRPADAADPDEPAVGSPAGATTPGAKRIAARLAEQGLGATACGRLAWLALGPDPADAAGQFRRCRTIAGVPLVLAVAGPRPGPLEPLVAELDLRVAVLPADADPALRELALAGTDAVLPPLPPGPPRWAAMAGLARLRSLAEVRR